VSHSGALPILHSAILNIARSKGVDSNDATSAVVDFTAAIHRHVGEINCAVGRVPNQSTIHQQAICDSKCGIAHERGVAIIDMAAAIHCQVVGDDDHAQVGKCAAVERQLVEGERAGVFHAAAAVHVQVVEIEDASVLQAPAVEVDVVHVEIAVIADHRAAVERDAIEISPTLDHQRAIHVELAVAIDAGALADEKCLARLDSHLAVQHELRSRGNLGAAIVIEGVLQLGGCVNRAAAPIVIIVTGHQGKGGGEQGPRQREGAAFRRLHHLQNSSYVGARASHAVAPRQSTRPSLKVVERAARCVSKSHPARKDRPASNA